MRWPAVVSGPVGDLLLGVEQLEDPLGRRDAALQQVHHRRHLGQRLGELPAVLDERLHLAQRDRAAGHAQPAEHGDHDVVEVPDEHHDRHDQAAHELRTERGPVELLVLLVEDPLRLGPAAVDLHQRVAGEGLLDVRVEGARTPPLLHEQPLRALHHLPRHDHRERHRDQRDHREQRRDPEHHPEHREHRQQRGEQLAHRLLQGLADVVDVVGDPAQQLTARLPVEVAQRQRVDLVLDVGPHPPHGALHDVVEQVAGQPPQQRAEDVDAEHDQQHPAHRVEVDALPGDDVHGPDHRGDLVLPLPAQPRHRLGLGQPLRQPAADQPGEDQVGRLAEHPRADRHRGDAQHGEQQHGVRLDPLGPHPAQQPHRGRPEVAGLLADHPAAHRAAPRAGRAGLHPLGLLQLLGRLTRPPPR